MTASITTLEQVLERYGDTLYRIAILFSASPAQAHELLLRFARSYASQSLPSDDQQLLEVLLPSMAETVDKKQANIQHGLRPTLDSLSGLEANLLAAILKLPRAQRAALAFLALQMPIDESMQLDERPLMELRRDALLSLAEVVNRPTLAAAMVNPEVDELCQATRAALILEHPGQHHSAAVRGHLALCTDCRSLAQSWQGLVGQVSEILRGILRSVHLPEELAERLLVAADPVPSKDVRSILRSPWLIRMAVPLFVLSVIAMLIFWRPAEEPGTPAVTGASTTDLQALVVKAQTQLYTSQSSGVSLYRYQIRWPFSDGSYAPMIGEIWHDPNQQQFRAQLRHEAGGAPYEFLLTGRGVAWYAVTPLYGESIYPLLLDSNRTRIELHLLDQQRDDLVQATLAKGAWGIPQLYLGQARAASLQSWGRQRIEDGTLVEVIGYRSDAVFSSQSSLQSIKDLQVTVLLLIDPAKGQLRELREVFGPPGGDQLSRTLWRYLGAEPLSNEQEIGRTFNISLAWNGAGRFEQSQFGFVHAALPLVDKNRLGTLELIDGGWSVGFNRPFQLPLLQIPAKVPEQVNAAFLIANINQETPGISVVYLGKGREFVFRNMLDTPANQALFTTDQSVETVTAGPYQALIRAVPGGYVSMLRLPPDALGQPLLMLSYARGYSREEVIASLSSLTLMSADSLKQQIELFATSENPPAVRELLMAALKQEHAVPNDQVRQLKYQLYTRYISLPDLLADPYHRPRDNGIPDTLKVTQWNYPARERPTVVAAQYEERRGVDDRLYSTVYTDQTGMLFYDHVFETIYGPFVPTTPVNTQQTILLKALLCGGGLLEEAQDGTQRISFSEQELTKSSCLMSNYITLMNQQFQSGGQSGFGLNAPYLADLSGASFTLTLTLDQQVLRKIETVAGGIGMITVLQNGQETQLRTQAGGYGEPIMLESWELLDDSLIPLTKAPNPQDRQAITRNAKSPQAFTDTVLIQQVTLTNTLKIAGGALFVPQQPEQAQYFVATNQPLVGSNFQSISNTIFEQALWNGIAVQVLLPVRESDGQTWNIITYQGAAEPFREFLRANAVWQTSAPDQIPLAGQMMDGWFVETTEGSSFTIVERDGLLLVLPRLWSETQAQALNGLRLVRDK